MTLLFPGVLMLVILIGVVIAYFVIVGGDGDGPDLIDGFAGGVEATSFFELISFLLPLMAFVIGASSIGADLKTGMVEQILTWEPRRVRFLAARCVANIVGGFLAAVAVAIVFTALIYGLHAAAGTTDGATGEFWGNVAVAVVRIGVAGGIFAVFGVGVALLVNSSVGAIVGFAIYFFIIEGLIGAFLPKVAVYLPVTNTSAFASGSDVQRAEGDIFSGDFVTVSSHGYVTAGLILAAWSVVAAVAASVVFDRRDVA